jgi:uncharacterized phage protein (TIGR02220 family)
VRVVNYWERYIGAIRKKTGRLDLTEKGAYDVLLDEYYALEAPLPDDVSELYRIANAHKKHERNAVRKVADLYFPVGPDGLRHNERADYEIARAIKRIEAAKENGAKGGRPRKANLPGIPPGSESGTDRVSNGFLYGNPDHNPGHNPDPNPIESSTYNKPQSLPIGKVLKARPDSAFAESSSGSPPDSDPEQTPPKHVNGSHGGAAKVRAMGEEARAVLAFLNDKAGKRFPPTESNVGIIVARRREGFTVEQLRAVIAIKVRAWGNDPEMREFLRPATLFGRSKFSQYVGELGPEDDDSGAEDDEPGITREREVTP